MKLVRIGANDYDIIGDVDDFYFQNINVALQDGLSRILPSILGEGAVTLDIGANIGITALIAREASPNGEVHAFEPSKEIFGYLERNVRHNDVTGVTLVNSAVGATDGQVTFHTDAYQAGSHIVSDSHVAYDHVSRDQEPVTLVSLDSYCRAHSFGHIDLIKIDVEGFELDVLRGARDICRNFNPIVIAEFNTWCLLAYADQNPRHVLEEICDMFSHVYYMSQNGLIPIGSSGEKHAFLNRHLIPDHCISDLLMTGTPVEGRLKIPFRTWSNVDEV
jgi:FkbM family methyltransferase